MCVLAAFRCVSGGATFCALASTDPPAPVLSLCCCFFLAQVQLFLFQLCLLSPPLPDSFSASRPAMARHTPPSQAFLLLGFSPVPPASGHCCFPRCGCLPPATLRLPLSPGASSSQQLIRNQSRAEAGLLKCSVVLGNHRPFWIKILLLS